MKEVRVNFETKRQIKARVTSLTISATREKMVQMKKQSDHIRAADNFYRLPQGKAGKHVTSGQLVGG